MSFFGDLYLNSTTILFDSTLQVQFFTLFICQEDNIILSTIVLYIIYMLHTVNNK